MEALSAFSLPPGFGFHPTDIELISHYLKRKILGLKIDCNVIPEIDIYKHEPWDLPTQCRVPTRDSKWHFFASRDKKYPNGSRSNRTTGAGYWKSTGKDRSIRHQNRVIGTKKTLVFHEGRPPTGKRSDWIMHEFYINENECKSAPSMKDAFVLCRVTKRNGWGLDGENVSEQPENVLAEEPKDVASSVMPSKSSSPSESAEDIEAWCNELFDPNFDPTLEVKSEPEEGHSALALNAEPINSHCLALAEVSEDSHLLQEGHSALRNAEPIDSHYLALADVSEDSHLLQKGHSALLNAEPTSSHYFSEDSHLHFPVNEFCDILLSDAQSYDGFEDFGIQNMAVFGDQQDDFFAGLTNNDDDAWGGIQRREREPRPSPPQLSQRRISVQSSKMKSRNAGESVSDTLVADAENYDIYNVRSFQNMAAFGDQLEVASDDNSVATSRGLSRRVSELGPTPSTLSQRRIRLQVSKMESRNGVESLCRAIRMDQNMHLDTNANARRGFVRGLRDSFFRCSSASRNCFFLVACMMGTAALIFCFLLRDARRFIGGFSALEL